MASNATKFGTVALGSAVAGALITLVVSNSLITRGNVVFDATTNTAPKIQTAQNSSLTDAIRFVPGTSTVVFPGVVNSSGGSVNLIGTFTGTGQLTLVNPLSETLLCGAPTLYTTTAASPTTLVNCSRSVRQGVSQLLSGSSSLIVRAPLSVGLVTSTGSAVNSVDGPIEFILDAAGGAYDYIYCAASTGTGQNVVSRLNVECNRLD